MKPVVNPFVDAEDAKRYQDFRPAYHDIPFQRLQQLLGRKVNRTLDVACGTGQSTRALAKISDEVIGCDLSAATLNEARRNSQIKFVEAPAEQLPFADASFGLLNISMAFHWTDQARFLREARRVLKPSGHMSIDCYGSKGELVGNPEFTAKNKEFYTSRLPKVARHAIYPDEAMAGAAGFTLAHEIPYEHTVEMSLAYFVGFIMTQSNFLAFDVQRRAELKDEIAAFYAPFFGNREQPLLFSGLLKLYKVTKPL